MNNLNINKYFVCELLENYLSQLGVYYRGSKSNQKKIVDLFYSLPFFFFEQKCQNILYKIIQKHNIKVHINSNKDMKKVCHNIYKEFCLNVNCPFKDYDEFYDSIHFKMTSDKYYMKKTKQNYIHSFIFSILFVGILCIYYWISKRLY